MTDPTDMTNIVSSIGSISSAHYESNIIQDKISSILVNVEDQLIRINQQIAQQSTERVRLGMLTTFPPKLVRAGTWWICYYGESPEDGLFGAGACPDDAIGDYLLIFQDREASSTKTIIAPHRNDALTAWMISNNGKDAKELTPLP